MTQKFTGKQEPTLEISTKGMITIFIGSLLVATFFAVLISGILSPSPRPGPPAVSIPYPSPAFELVNSIGVGWNLGNALDSRDDRRRGIVGSLTGITPEEHYETYWGNPVTTFEMIESIAQMGFGAVRIPVTYSDHLYDDFQIRADWLARVRQVVGYVLDTGMYAVINIHHDTGRRSWLRADPDNIEQVEEQLATVWEQIAVYFQDYCHRLIFEGFNEIRDMEGRWFDSDAASYNAVNRLNQVFVDTVRGTGGNNAGRFLIVKTYAAATDIPSLRAFVLPYDSAYGRLIVGVHYYGPLAFTWRQEQVNWTTAYSDWCPVRDGRPVEDITRRLWEYFISRGIPVIICEFGAVNKNNTQDRINFATHYIETARQYGIICFWWDDGGQHGSAETVTNFALFDRFRNEWFFPEIAEALINAAGAAR